MGSPRSMFRRDKQMARQYCKKDGYSSSEQTVQLKKEHTRRQRQADRLDAHKCKVNELFDTPEEPIDGLKGEENGKIDEI